MTKPSKTDSRYAERKDEAIAALRAAWALARDWRPGMRALNPCHDAGMPHWVGLTAWETYERPSAAEMPELREIGRELGLDAMKPWEIYQAACQEFEATEASWEVRLAEARRLIAVAEGEEERPWCVMRKRMLVAARGAARA